MSISRSGISGGDYIANEAVLTIPSGIILDNSSSVSFCVNITIIGDNRKEGPEDFRVTFTPITPDIFENGINTVIAVIYEENDRKLVIVIDIVC